MNLAKSEADWSDADGVASWNVQLATGGADDDISGDFGNWGIRLPAL
jgi:hypothetical protein